MAGYSIIRRVHAFERYAAELGFKIVEHQYGFDAELTLSPADDKLMAYSRNAAVFSGTLEQAEIWLRGFERGRMYDTMLFGRDQRRRRDRKEQDLLNKSLMQVLREPSE